MAIEDIDSKASLRAFIRDVIGLSPSRLRTKPTRYMTADRPPAADREGEIIYVPDGGAGANYQASIGTGWVNLG